MNKLVSAICLRLPLFTRATGDGLASLPLLAPPPVVATGAADGGRAAGGDYGAAVVGSAVVVGGSGADPVTERRRERALRALDKKLAELRSNMRGGPMPGPALVAMPPTPVQQEPAPLAEQLGAGVQAQ